MPDTPASALKTGIIKKLIVALAVSIGVMVSLFICLVLFLPKFVSTESFKSFLENQTSGVLMRPVQIEALKWKWTDEILVKNISMKDDPVFSNKPIFSAKSTRIKIFYREILNGRLHFDVALDDIKAGFIRNKSGQTNIGLLLTQFESAGATKKPRAPISLKGAPFSVPFDIRGRVHLNKFSIRVDDHLRDKQLVVKNASLRLNIPSLYLEAIELKASADIEIDSTKVPSARLNVSIKDLFNPQGTLGITGASVNMEGVCPGAKFAFNSDLNELNMNSRIELDLFKFAKILEPFIPPYMSPAETLGNLRLVFHGSANPPGSLSFNTTLEGKGLSLSRGFLGDKTLGPIDFHITNRGTLDAVKGILAIENGTLDFLEKTRLAWNGEVKDLYSFAPQADLNFGSIRIDIGELFDKFGEFAPEAIKLSGNTQQSHPILEIMHMGFSGPVPSGPNDIKINGLVLKIPEFHLAPKESQDDVLSVADVRLTVLNLKSTLKEFFPSQVSLSASLISDSIDIKGKKDIHVDALSIPNITVRADDIHRSGKSPIGLTASFQIHESLTADEISIPPFITIKDVQQAADVKVEFPADSNVALSIKDLEIKSPSLTVESPTHTPFKTNARFDCRIDRISFIGMDPLEIDTKGLVLQIPEFHLASKESQGDVLSVADVRLTVQNLKSTLKEFFPSQVSLSASLISDSIDIKGKKDIHVDTLSIPSITVRSDDIHRSKKSLVGLTASFQIHESLTTDEISIPAFITIKDVQQAADVKVEFPVGSNTALLVVEDLKINSPSIMVASPIYGSFKTKSKLGCRIDRIALLGMDPLDVDVKGIRSNLLIDDVLTVNFEAGAENMARGGLKTKGHASIDMAPLTEKFISKVYDKIKLTGRTRLTWDITGRLPNNKEMTKLRSSSIDFKDDLGFVERLEVSCRVKDMGAELIDTKGRRWQVKSLSTGTPLRYSFDNKTGRGIFDGNILLQGIDKVPFKAVSDKNLSADVHVSGQHDYLQSAALSLAMDLKPVNINQTLDISLNGMDRIFKKNLKMPLPLWFKYVGGTARGVMHLSEETNIEKLIENLSVEGTLAAGAEIRLVPGENIRVEAWASSPEMHVSLGESFSVKGLQTNLVLGKDYHIIGGEIRENLRNISMLSESVLRAESEPAAGASIQFDTEDAAVAKFMGKLQTRFSTQHAISFKSAYIGIEPLPLSMDRAMIDFDLNEGLPNSDYFQLELLGGTLIGSVSVLQKNDGFFLQTGLSFSGLDTARIYPAAGTGAREDSELSGQLWALIPLSSQPSLLHDLQLTLNISHIGPRSLERFLYALDPSESNEVIVSQRQLLRLGFPRWIHIEIVDERLSLDGEAEVKGVPVAIPSLRRLNLANTSGLENYAEYLGRLAPVIKALKVFSANAVKIGEDGAYLKFQTTK
ncbi:hypothetical protein ACFL9U_02765 [Thermodesulfobacteriota bacterium]